MTNKCYLTVGLTALVLVLARAGAEDPSRDGGKPEAMKLTGTYLIVGEEKFGAKVPPDRLRHDVVRFTEDTITVTDEEKKDTYVAAYELELSKKPWAIAMVSKAPKSGERAAGLIERDGDTVRLIYALPGGKTPTEFRTKEKQMMFTLKRMNPSGSGGTSRDR